MGIDQNNIDDDLRCLPIFLSGCKHLVIMVGKTYLSRLWCILEIFTFVHMGGDVDRILLVPLIREGFECEDEESIMHAFKNFNARDCECFDANDKERMLNIIHTAFGDMEGFNEAVRHIFRDAGLDFQSVDISTDESDLDGDFSFDSSTEDVAQNS